VDLDGGDVDATQPGTIHAGKCFEIATAGGTQTNPMQVLAQTSPASQSAVVLQLPLLPTPLPSRT
jgi:hypothetical protein